MDGSQNIFDQQQANSFIPSLMLEYISPKYEEESFNEIEENIKNMTESGELAGISAKITDKGLLITFDDKYLFAPGSAYLSSNAKKLIDKVGVLICKKFVLHAMRIEGHTDSQPISSDKYPSNWELSAARASSVVRYMISRFMFAPNLFTAIGYADTRPLETSYSPKDPANRRVEILVLKNSYKNSFENTKTSALSLSKKQQEEIQQRRERVIAQVEQDSISPAAQKLLEENNSRIQKQKSEKLSEKSMDLYINIDKEAKTKNKENMPPVNQKVIKMNQKLPEDEDFGL